MSLFASGSDGALTRAYAHAAVCEPCRLLLACVGRVRAHGRSPKPAAARVQPGSALKRYRLLREIGRGAMGVVYEAHDPRLERSVAIKLTQTATPGRLARIAREARAVAKLSHPNVVQIFDVGLTGEQAFIAMELVGGPTLRDWIDGRTRPWRQVLSKFIDAGKGLAAAHAVGLVHRDFKPANVLVDPTGRVVVLDFGLAREVGPGDPSTTADGEHSAGSSTLTGTGVAVGTPVYMAPEQHLGERVTPQADVYAFGVALYQALYGRLPFTGGRVSSLLHVKGQGLPASPPDAGVPSAVYAAIRRATAYDPKQRFASMDAMLGELQRVTVRRRRVAAAFGAAAAVALWGWFAAAPRSADSQPIPAPSAAQIDRDLEARALELVDDSKDAGEEHAHEAVGIAIAARTAAVGSGSAAALARAEIQLGIAHKRVAQYGLATDHLRRGVSVAQDAGEEHVALRGATELIFTLGVLERVSEAMQAGRQARALAERVGDDGRMLIEILQAESGALRSDAIKERVQRREEVLAIARAKPDVVDAVSMSSILTALGGELMLLDVARARRLLEEAVDVRLRELGPDDRATLQSQLVLAQLESNEGEQRRCIEMVGEILARAPENAMPLRVASNMAISVCHAEVGELELALERIDEALELAKLFSPPGSDLEAEMLNNRGAMLSMSGDTEGADATLQRVLVIRETHAKGPSQEIAEVCINLGESAMNLGEPQRAEGYYRRALAELEAVDGSRVAFVYAHTGLGKVLIELGRFEDALEVLGRNVNVKIETTEPLDPMRVVQARGLYAQALWEVGRKDDALEMARDVLATLEGPEFEGDRRALRAWMGERA